MCSPGYRAHDVDSYTSTWETKVPPGHTGPLWELCWNYAHGNVTGAVGIWWNFTSGACRAIDNLPKLGPWQTSWPDDQRNIWMCLHNPSTPRPTALPTPLPLSLSSPVPKACRESSQSCECFAEDKDYCKKCQRTGSCGQCADFCGELNSRLVKVNRLMLQ